jgi:hypothetical protein
MFFEMITGQRPKGKRRDGEWSPFSSDPNSEKMAQAVSVPWCHDRTVTHRAGARQGSPIRISLDYPADQMSPEAIDLLTKVPPALVVTCELTAHMQIFVANPRERLGYGGIDEIKRHPFFRGLDWDALARKDITPPFTPEERTVHAKTLAEVDEQHQQGETHIQVTEEVRGRPHARDGAWVEPNDTRVAPQDEKLFDANFQYASPVALQEELGAAAASCCARRAVTWRCSGGPFDSRPPRDSRNCEAGVGARERAAGALVTCACLLTRRRLHKPRPAASSPDPR